MRIGNIVQIILFIGFLVTGSALTFFVRMSTDSSETENRSLASLPEFSMQTALSGTYFRQLENYAADHIGFRQSLVQTSKFIASLQGKPGSDSALIVNSNADNTGDAQPASPIQKTSNPGKIEPSPQPQTYAQQQAGILPKQSAAEEKGKVQGRVLILGDRAMNLFTYNPAAGQDYADAINQIQARINQAIPNTVQTSVLLAPTAAEFIQSPKLKSLSDSQRKAIDDVYGKIDPHLVKVDALSVMNRHADEALFFRTDHHWTATGAYYAYTAFAEAEGINPVPLTAYEKGEVPDFLGSLYSSTMNRGLAARPDTIVFYKPFVKHRYAVHYTGSLDMPLIDLSHAAKKNKYRIFLSGDRPWAHITTQTNNSRKLLVIKDSYGNALVPFLLPHYGEIFVVDPRQFDQQIVPFIQKHQIQDILYINNAHVTMDKGFADQLRKMIRE